MPTTNYSIGPKLFVHESVPEVAPLKHEKVPIISYLTSQVPIEEMT